MELFNLARAISRQNSHRNTQLLFMCAWIFCILFTCLACLPVYSVAWMAIPNDNPTNDMGLDPQNGPIREIMNIGSNSAPFIACKQEPSTGIAPHPSPYLSNAPLFQSMPQLPSPKEEKHFIEPEKGNHCSECKKNNCCCDFTDVADDNFFSVLNGIGVAVKFFVSLPWYLISRGLEYCLITAHWMVGAAISHPILCIFIYSFIISTSTYSISIISDQISSLFCFSSGERVVVHKKVVPVTRTRIVRREVEEEGEGSEHHREEFGSRERFHSASRSEGQQQKVQQKDASLLKHEYEEHSHDGNSEEVSHKSSSHEHYDEAEDEDVTQINEPHLKHDQHSGSTHESHGHEETGHENSDPNVHIKKKIRVRVVPVPVDEEESENAQEH